jgi:hypothetical protein
MEKDPIEGGYTIVISDELSDVGYQEMMTKTRESVQRYIVIPESFHKQEVHLPEQITRLETTESKLGYVAKIPSDSIPLNILDLNRIENLTMKYPGIVSNLKASIEKIKQDNPDFIKTLEAHGLTIEDILTVSIQESQVNILL